MSNDLFPRAGANADSTAVLSASVSRRIALKLAGAGLAPLIAPAPAFARVTREDRGPRDYARLIVTAQRAGRRVPPASSFEPGMSEARAYAFQRAVVAAAMRRDAIAGIKGGGMTAPSQARLGGGPFLGVLPRSGRVAPGATLRLSNYRQLAIETEIGFELAQRISTPLPDVAMLRRYVAAIRPVIELPDNALEGGGRFTAVDLIASNVLARDFIAGPPSPPMSVDLDDLVVRLRLNGAPIHEAAGRDTFGSQWTALLWLVNHAVRHHGPLERGCLIITGALGGALMAKPGRYSADFAELGAISFSVE